MDWSENFRLNKHTPFSASPICTWQSQAVVSRGGETKCIKRGNQDGLRPLLWGWPVLKHRGCTILCLPNKILSCNQAVTSVHCFNSLLQWDTTKEITHSFNTGCALQDSVSPILWKFCNQIPLVFKVKFPGGSQSFPRSPRWGIYHGA